MKFVAYGAALFLAGLGLLFLVAAGQTNALVRIVIGLGLLAAAVVLVVVVRLRPTEQVHRYQVDLSGDVALEDLSCRRCGAELDRESIELQAGAVVVSCGHCGAHYQIEEAPRW